MSSSVHGHARAVDGAHSDDAITASTRHYQNSEHLSNERTHWSYMGTAIGLLSIGIFANRFSLYLIESEELEPSHPALTILHNAKQVGLGMVLYGFALMVLAIYRYFHVSRAIDNLDYRPQGYFVEALTMSTLAAGALSLIWIFLR
jgi:putative membrane protein